MASRIRGITVEIGGDTTGLEKALKSVNSTLKTTQSQLKDVERLLKLDPSNTELLAQKQRLLKDAIGATKEKLDALKTAQEQAKQQLENGTLGQDKYDALQREIIETENELKKLAAEAGKTNTALKKMDEAGKTIENVGGKITKVGQGLTKYVTTPILAIGAAAIAAFGEVDGAMDTLITKTGATGAALEGMETAVANLATTIPTDFQTAANAVGEVNTRFNVTGETLEKLSGQFIKFAAINNSDVSTAIDNVQASMAAFGVQTKDAGLVLDMLTQAAHTTGTDVNQLTTSLTQNAGAMKEMGLSYEESAFFLANLNKNGIDASSVMAGLKKAWQTASKEGKSMQDVVSEMSKKIKSATTDQEAYQAAIEVFGAKAGPAIAQAMRDGRLELDFWVEDLEAFDGVVEDTFNGTLDPIDQTTMFMNELKLTGAELAATIQELLLPAMGWLREKLQELRAWWGGLSEEQQQNIVKMAGIAAAIGPILMLIGNLTSTVGKGMQAFSSMGQSLSSLLSMSAAGTGPLASLGGSIGAIAGPVLAVVAVIAVLAAAFAHLWKTSEEFRDKMTGIWEGIKTKFETTVGTIREKLTKAGKDGESFVDKLKKVWDGFCKLLGPVFEGNFQIVANTFSAICDKITGILDIFIGLFTQDWDQAWNGVKTYFTACWNEIKGYLSAVLNAIKGIVNVFLGWFGTDWDTVWGGAKTFFTTTWNAIKTTATNVVNGIKNTFSTGFNAAKNTVTTVFNSIKEKITTVMNTIKETVKSVIDKIKGFFDFHFELPHIPLPHIHIQPDGWQIGDLLKGVIPSLGIDWYKKAMNRGMILNSPTIFGMQNGHLLAGGEAGSETVVGTNSLMEMIQGAVASGGTSVNIESLNVNVESYGTNAAEIADEIGAALSEKLRMAGSW